MKLEQPILKYDINDIIIIIEKIMKNIFEDDIKIFFPKNKEWFLDNITKLKKICNNNIDIEKTLIEYKRNNYKMIKIVVIYMTKVNI